VTPLSTDHVNSSQLVRTALLEKISRNPRYSLRALARDLGVTHSYLSQVVSGKKGLSVSRFLQVSHILKLDESTTQAVIRSNKLGTKRERISEEKRHFVSLEVDRFRILNEWFHIAILDLTLLKTFKAEARWIAGRLGITTREAQRALLRLKRLKLLVRENGSWKKGSSWLEIMSPSSNALIREYHKQMIQKGLTALTEQDIDERDITGSTIPANPQRLEGAKRKIKKFRREIIKYLGEGDCTELYQLNVQLFLLTEGKNS
jgi:uncharacterized protein (TIGR02147 family)